jgi:hypothetical protein
VGVGEECVGGMRGRNRKKNFEKKKRRILKKKG